MEEDQTAPPLNWKIAVALTLFAISGIWIGFIAGVFKELLFLIRNDLLLAENDQFWRQMDRLVNTTVVAIVLPLFYLDYLKNIGEKWLKWTWRTFILGFGSSWFLAGFFIPAL